MARTEREIRQDINTVECAIQEIISGERVTKLLVGSGEFQRTYQFSEITYESLREIKAELLQELDIILTGSQVTYRQNSHLPLVVTKFPR